MGQSQLFAKKSLKVLLDEMKGDNRLRRALGPVTLTALGIGAVIGAGIFVATGAAANEKAGPALMVSYGVAGLTCIFAALCYAEFASMAPVAGSAFTYAYCTLGELFAWIIGWDLVLEYAVGAAAVANGWSGYFQSVLDKLDITIPKAVSGSPQKYEQSYYFSNMEGKYSIKVTQRAMNEERAVWADGSDQPAKGNYWVFTIKVMQDGTPIDKHVVVGQVGDTKTEAKIKDKELWPKTVNQKGMETKKLTATWAEGDPKPANGVYWAFTVKEKNSDKTVVVGAVGDQAIEAKISDRQQAYLDLPAILVALLVTAVLVKGIKESAGFNALMVGIKVAAVLFVILVGTFYINPDNWTRDFAPYGWTGITFFGIPIAGQQDAEGNPRGVLAGAAIIFFAYIGFDSVSTHAEEAKNPQRDVPIGIVSSLIICTILYIAVVAVLTGMVDYKEISKSAGVADAFKTVGLGWARFIIAMAGVAGITSVLLVMMLSAPRVFLAMARDGLVPSNIFASVHPTFRTPWISTILIGVCVAAMTGFLPLDALLLLTNIGTLFAFVIVCGAVLIMRKTNPEAERPFRCPMVPVVPILGILLCLLLMFSLPWENWVRLLAWLFIGLLVYALYGRHHSILGKELRGEPVERMEFPAGLEDGGH